MSLHTVQVCSSVCASLVFIDIDHLTSPEAFPFLVQINEDTGNSRAVRRRVVDATVKKGSSTLAANASNSLSQDQPQQEDPRGVALSSDPELCHVFMHALFGVLYEVFSNMVRRVMNTSSSVMYCSHHTLPIDLSSPCTVLGCSFHKAQVFEDTT